MSRTLGRTSSTCDRQWESGAAGPGKTAQRTPFLSPLTICAAHSSSLLIAISCERGYERVTKCHSRENFLNQTP